MTSLKALIADLARPYTFYTLATASCIAIVKMAWSITDGYQAAAFMGVVLAGASAIYIGKSFENASLSRHATDLEKTRAVAGAPSPPVEALKPAEPAAAADPAADAEPDAVPDPAMYGGPRA